MGVALAKKRLHMVQTESSKCLTDFAQDVAKGLGAQPKQLSPRYFYDARGSKLFEDICRLPEYYLTRAEAGILALSSDQILDEIPGNPMLVELGSGSAVKTRLLLDSLFKRKPDRFDEDQRVTYAAIDISQSALQESAAMLLDQYPTLEMLAIHAEYRKGLRILARRATRSRLVLWLGSNVGNLEPEESTTFLRQIRRLLTPQDRMLIGTDLIKERTVLEAAYDDAAGVTAAFNKNVLARINRELGGHFSLDHFEHKAIFNEKASRVEMHLVSLKEQHVSVDALETIFPFAVGETIHTECSHKYSQSQIELLAHTARFTLGRQWMDAEKRFALNLFVPT